MGAFGCLAAADAVHEEFPILDKSSYTRMALAAGGDMVLKDGVLFPIFQKVTWDHQSGQSYRTAVEYIGDLSESFNLTVSKVTFTHVDVKPSAEALANVLWKNRRVIAREQVNHRFLGDEPSSLTFGGCRFTQFKLKNGAFRMYRNRYEVVVADYTGMIDGAEEIAFTRFVGKSFVESNVEVNIKKHGKPWMSDPIGQGSAGEQPDTEVALNEKFRQLFPEYADFI